MHRFTRRILGMLFSLLAAISLLVSLGLILQTWRVQAGISQQIVDSSAQAQALLESTASGLAGAQETVSATINTLKVLHEPLLAVAQGVRGSQPALDEAQAMAGENLPQTITATQISLHSAQQSAAAMESLLKLVSQIPFFPGGPYNPTVSLEDSLGQVAKDLETLREPLAKVDASLGTAQSSLDGLDNQVIKLILQLDQIRYSLESTNQSIEESRGQLVAVKVRLEKANKLIPQWVSAGAWLVTFILAWLAMAQVLWFEKGWRMLRSPENFNKKGLTG